MKAEGVFLGFSWRLGAVAVAFRFYRRLSVAKFFLFLVSLALLAVQLLV
jgi:hypothetical protein